MYIVNMETKTAFDVERMKHIGIYWSGEEDHGWMTAALLREKTGLEGHATFENVESKFNFPPGIRQVSPEATTQWLYMALQKIWNVGQEWTRSRMGVHMDMRQGGAIKYAVFCGQTITGLCRTQKMHSGQMLKELIEEAGRWDPEQKPASLWLSSTCAKQDKEDMMIKTKSGRTSFPIRKASKFSGTSSSQLGNHKKAWKSKCRKPTKNVGQMQKDTQAKTCHGD